MIDARQLYRGAHPLLLTMADAAPPKFSSVEDEAAYWKQQAGVYKSGCVVRTLGYNYCISFRPPFVSEFICRERDKWTVV